MPFYEILDVQGPFIQELALAKNVRILCGTYKFTWYGIRQVFQGVIDGNTGKPYSIYFEESREMDFDGVQAYTLTEVQQRTSNNLNIRDMCLKHLTETQSIEPASTWNSPLSLPVVVAITWSSKATDPRDSIYGLLGIARHDPGLDVIADYKWPTEELFIEFARRFMEGSPKEPIQEWKSGICKYFDSLEGLPYLQRPFTSAIQPELPSWVADFNSPLVMNRLWSPDFSAGTMNGPPKIIPSSNPLMLHLKGICCDYAVHVEPRVFEPDQYGVSIRNWIGMMKRMSPAYVATGEARIEAFWRTLMTNRQHHSSQKPGDETKKSFKIMVGTLMALVLDGPGSKDDPGLRNDYSELQVSDISESLPSFDEIKEISDEVIKSNPESPESEKLIDLSFMRTETSKLACSMRQYYTARTLFTTKYGYLGLAPLTICPGDEVWIIPGARVPFILRKLPNDDSERRTVVCEAYVHGIMHGEVVLDHHGEFSPAEVV